METALRPTRFIDSDHPVVREFVAGHAGAGGPLERAVNLYYALRDRIAYDMGTFGVEEDQFVASNVLRSTSAFCVPKAVALAAVVRASGIPARLGFANVRNHLVSPRLAPLLDDDIFRWHAYTAIHLGGRWVKATPAFDAELCRRHHVRPLDFDGRADSIFHPFDQKGRKHMEYVDFIGDFDDVPFERFAADMRKFYPRLLTHLEAERMKSPHDTRRNGDSK
ncbi:Transglutaminase domain protein [Mesorhizobium plurifarium]|uniref:Transglutaminase domain protein n=1 Tax=Mesorhizobium plurifarium TaxID=69974 RepID=A0A0K2W0R0_MESPL|nr:Transglutaminase domain protein [Mesorhizobium plurifarium]